jgi:hypothetical protein
MRIILISSFINVFDNRWKTNHRQAVK